MDTGRNKASENYWNTIELKTQHCLLLFINNEEKRH